MTSPNVALAAAAHPPRTASTSRPLASPAPHVWTHTRATRQEGIVTWQGQRRRRRRLLHTPRTREPIRTANMQHVPRQLSCGRRHAAGGGGRRICTVHRVKRTLPQALLSSPEVRNALQCSSRTRIALPLLQASLSGGSCKRENGISTCIKTELTTNSLTCTFTCFVSLRSAIRLCGVIPKCFECVAFSVVFGDKCDSLSL